jgi:transcriptional regulator with XRE-family HTH domain
MARRTRTQAELERWYEWMRALGDSTRKLRTLLGLTQEQLGRLAGVSQGAVSRLEGGRGVSTPLIVVVRIQQAFQQSLAQIDPTQVTPELQASAAEGRLGELGCGSDFRDVPVLHEPRLADYMSLWHRVHPARRDTFLAVVRATAAAMTGSQSERPGPPEHASGRSSAMTSPEP